MTAALIYDHMTSTQFSMFNTYPKICIVFSTLQNIFNQNFKFQEISPLSAKIIVVDIFLSEISTQSMSLSIFE